MMRPYPSMKQGVATCIREDYSALAGANSPDGRENPNHQTAPKRPKDYCWRFIFACNNALWRLCARHASAWPVSVWAGFSPLRTVRHHLPRENGGDGSIPNGATPTRHTLTLNPSKARAAAHKAMAVAALHANSSLSVRLARYRAHMTKARSLEIGGAK